MWARLRYYKPKSKKESLNSKFLLTSNTNLTQYGVKKQLRVPIIEPYPHKVAIFFLIVTFIT